MRNDGKIFASLKEFRFVELKADTEHYIDQYQ